MMDLLKTLAPTVASVLLGPMAGLAVTGLGKIFNLEGATIETISKAVSQGQMTPEQLGKIKELELQFLNDEAERGFRYAELEFKDRDSARSMAVSTGAKTPAILTWIIVGLVLGLEGSILILGLPEGANELVLGRVLGTLDASLMTVLAYWFGTTFSSGVKNATIAQAVQPK